jgi:hypothetical protein
MSCNNEKCSKLDFILSRFFPDFYLLPSYFSALESDFRFVLNQNSAVTWGPPIGDRLSCFHWPSWVAPSYHTRRHKTPRPTALVRSLCRHSGAVASSSSPVAAPPHCPGEPLSKAVAAQFDILLPAPLAGGRAEVVRRRDAMTP